MARSALPSAADLSDTCTLCSQLVHPRDIAGLDMFGNRRCPHCRGIYNLMPRNATGGMTNPPINHHERPTHRVYMRFELCLEVWRVTLTAPGATLREYTFADRDKVEAMAKRGGALRTLADQQSLDLALRNGRGGIDLLLTNAQLDAIRR